MRVHYGRHATLYYEWEGRRRFFGGRIGGLMTFLSKTQDDPRFAVRFISLGGVRYQPDQLEVYR